MTQPDDTARGTAIGPNDILRFLLELFAFVSLAVWGFTTWPLPLNIVFGLATPAIAILLWALFLSPKAMVHLDVYGRSLIELVVMGSAALAWLGMGQPIVAVVFGVLAVVSGLLSGRRALS